MTEKWTQNIKEEFKLLINKYKLKSQVEIENKNKAIQNLLEDKV